MTDNSERDSLLNRAHAAEAQASSLRTELYEAINRAELADARNARLVGWLQRAKSLLQRAERDDPYVAIDRPRLLDAITSELGKDAGQ